MTTITRKKRLDLSYLESAIKLCSKNNVKHLKTDQFEIILDDKAFIEKIDDDTLKKIIKESKISNSDKDLLYASAIY